MWTPPTHNFVVKWTLDKLNNHDRQVESTKGFCWLCDEYSCLAVTPSGVTVTWLLADIIFGLSMCSAIRSDHVPKCLQAQW